MLDSRCSKSAACLHHLARSSHDIGENGDGEFQEADPAGRYIRYKEVLGRGAFKTVYRAFDEVDGIEVAWNQIKLRDVVRSPEDLERLYSEVHLLKTLKHRNIIKFYHSWVDVEAQNLNFITEIFTSGTLKQYRKRHKCVDIRAVKNWSRQILRGLLYLHSHDPPIIHRDLKCDNIFINGNHGEVKIGDLGLATMLRHAHSAHSVIGTPEFMAPELYEEEYNELIDIYSFGMCLLEMITSEYPYSECTNAAQIYKKVTSGRKPAALDRVEDPDLRNFVEKCLATASRRLPARELLMDPFLQCDGSHDTLEPSPVMSGRASSVDDVETLLLHSPIQPSLPFPDNALQSENLCKKSPAFGMKEKKGRNRSIDFRVKGKRRENDIVHLRLRIADSEGQVRHIHFPFDIEADTAMCVASEMVAELDLADQDVTVIAEMIDASVLVMVPEWRPGVAIDEPYTDGEDTSTYESAHDSITNKHWHPDHLSTVSSESTLMDQSQHGSTFWHDATSVGTPAQADNMMHGRFEEVMYYHHRPEGRANLEDEHSMVSAELCDGGPPDESSASVSPTSSDAKAVCGPQVFMYNELVNSKVKIRLTRCNGKRWIPGLHIRNMAVHKGKPKHVDCLDTEPDGHTSRQLNYDLGGEDDDDQNESIAHELQELVSDYQQELKTLQREHEAALLKWRRKWQDKGASLDFLKLQEEKLFSGDEHGVGLVSTSI